MRLVIGFDVGGTRSRARLASEAEVVAEAEAGSANPAAVGEAAAESVLGDLVARLAGGRPVEAAVAGVAGADSPAALAEVAARLGRLLPGARTAAVHDTRLVLAAAGLPSGIALVAGTGSVAYARTPAGCEFRAGGWGHRLGDEGSGYWVTREAIRRLLAAGDAGEPAPDLAAALGGRAPLELVHDFHASPDPGRWAALAPELLAVQPDLVGEAAEALTALVGRVRRRSGLEGPIVLSGGLLLGVPALATAVTRRLGGDVRRLQEPPVAGAVRLALEWPNF